MAYLQPYGTGFGYPQYSFAPTAFGAPQFAHHHIEHHSQAADGSQAGEEHGSQAVSVSGFAADPNAAAFYGQQFGAAPFMYGAPAQATYIQGATVLPQHTVLPSTALVPVAAPRVHRPGYNERLVAWRNRQKAFNRYKKATKQAIKNSNQQAQLAHYGLAPSVYGGVAPTAVYGAAPFGATAFGAAPFGATYLPAYGGAGFVYDQGFAAAPVQAEAQEGAYPTFGDFSQGGASQHQEAAEEPEIRGTQV